MLLAIDIGNTNAVFALFDQGEKQGVWRCGTRDDYMSFLQGAFADDGFTFAQVSGVIVSSVVPDVDEDLRERCQEYFGLMPVFVTYNLVPVAPAVDRPEQIGADRLVNAVAVADGYSLPAVVVDFGTATTFDVVNVDGAYCGGVIAPGIHLSIEALERATAKLPSVEVLATKRVIAQSTDEAIQAGIFWGYIGLIEKIVAQIADELGVVPSVIATGGLAPLFADHVDMIEAVDRDLTLKGLLKIYEGLK